MMFLWLKTPWCSDTLADLDIIVIVKFHLALLPASLTFPDQKSSKVQYLLSQVLCITVSKGRQAGMLLYL